jgi:VWFA-related protein
MVTMTSTRRPVLLLLTILLTGCAGVSMAEETTRVIIRHPLTGQFLADQEKIEAEVLPSDGASVIRVEFFADGELIGVDDEAPYILDWVPGDRMLYETLIEVQALDSRGQWADASVRSRPLKVDLVSEVRLVEVYATVTDRRGRFVDGLTGREFVVAEDGWPQGISHFSAEDKPLKLAMLLDCSQSMARRDQAREKIELARRAASRFAETVAQEDQFTVLSFHESVNRACPFTNSALQLQQAIGSLEIGRGTALYDAVHEAVDLLGRDTGRKAILLLSDGRDESYDGLSPGSRHTFHQALEHALRSDVAVFVIGLGREVSHRSIIDGTSLEEQLTLLARRTGGSAHFPRRARELTDFYDRVADELKHQYTIGYSSTNQRRDGAWRRIAVDVPGHNVTVKAREGYYARR